jgi:hypothetical protein
MLMPMRSIAMKLLAYVGVLGLLVALQVWVLPRMGIG